MEMNSSQKAGELIVAGIYDSKVGAYFQPFFARSRAEAIRSFSDTVNKDGHIFNNHPGDFTLFVLATWSEDNGKFTSPPAPESLGSGHEYLQPSVPEPQLDLVQS